MGREGRLGQRAAALPTSAGVIFVAHFPVYKAASSAFSHGTLPVVSTVPLSL